MAPPGTLQLVLSAVPNLPQLHRVLYISHTYRGVVFQATWHPPSTEVVGTTFASKPTLTDPTPAFRSTTFPSLRQWIDAVVASATPARQRIPNYQVSPSTFYVTIQGMRILCFYLRVIFAL